MKTITDFFNFEILNFNNHTLSIFDLSSIIVIVIITKLVLWLISKALFNKKKLHKLDEGSAFALFQIIKYLIWIIAITLMLEALGIKVTILLAGSAALLVGVGLGLQQTFNDMLSGIILLFEHSVKVGDIRGIIERKISSNPNLIFSVQTHPRTKYQDYLRILDQLKEAKATKISIANPPSF